MRYAAIDKLPEAARTFKQLANNFNDQEESCAETTDFFVRVSKRYGRQTSPMGMRHCSYTLVHVSSTDLLTVPIAYTKRVSTFA